MPEATSLSPKLHADYVELTNGYLDSIPLCDPKQAQAVADALAALAVQFDPASADKHPSLKGRVAPNNADAYAKDLEMVRGLLEEPESYAEPENRTAFTAIVTDRIARWTEEVRAMTQEQLASRSEERALKHRQASAAKETVSTRSAPAEDSPAHVVSEEAALLEQLIVETVEGLPNHFDADWRKDAALFLFFVRINAKVLELADESLRKDLNFMFQATLLNHEAAQYIDRSLREDPIAQARITRALSYQVGMVLIQNHDPLLAGHSSVRFFVTPDPAATRHTRGRSSGNPSQGGTGSSGGPTHADGERAAAPASRNGERHS